MPDAELEGSATICLCGYWKKQRNGPLGSVGSATIRLRGYWKYVVWEE